VLRRVVVDFLTRLSALHWKQHRGVLNGTSVGKQFHNKTVPSDEADKRSPLCTGFSASSTTDPLCPGSDIAVKIDLKLNKWYY